eukprot:CAMPEP_0185254464 /NCGR_PEP_ID=MMETSP1359-20130426/3263_1 /TAXON_ID=552665 /ORGANISM="Bigelowiella longifila, Strain CCMP242" /LENGTH=221 /DNA_ID=CAMNT_0027837491 /DNA_START=20 /DNA_END=685 /DNA_ORIENTATION=-
MESILSVMAAEGPVVTGVLLSSDGKAKEMKLDMTPRLNTPGSTLGGPVTFLGAMGEIDVVIMARRDQENLPENQHSLPKPFNKMKVNGDMLLVRMNEDAVPEEFTLEEYNKHVEKKKSEPDVPEEENQETHEEAELADDDEDEDYEEDEDDDEDEDKDDEEGGEEEEVERNEEVKDENIDMNTTKNDISIKKRLRSSSIKPAQAAESSDNMQSRKKIKSSG